MSYFIFRIKDDKELKSRVLSTILEKNPAYSIKDYKEERDPLDGNYKIISLTVYEKGPYCPVKKILRELRENNDIECLTRPSSDRFL